MFNVHTWKLHIEFKTGGWFFTSNDIYEKLHFYNFIFEKIHNVLERLTSKIYLNLFDCQKLSDHFESYLFLKHFFVKQRMGLNSSDPISFSAIFQLYPSTIEILDT